MPTTPRKSSLGPARRGPKPHVPYRDGGEVGKKTGIAVQHVQRKSDGFEPFEDVIGQADKRSPLKVKGRKKGKKSSLAVIEDENENENEDEDENEDENGEMSMELEGSEHNAPPLFIAYQLTCLYRCSRQPNAIFHQPPSARYLDGLWHGRLCATRLVSLTSEGYSSTRTGKCGYGRRQCAD
jgi:hypothetical protein